MICINNLLKCPKFQDLNNKTFNPCLTLGHHKKDINSNIEYSSQEFIQELRKASECHKMVRYQLQNYIRPGMKIFDICNFVENSVVKNFNQNNMKSGIGFPLGYSINNCAAHDTASPNDERVLHFDDVVKIDFGTHVSGRIIDSAFTLAYNPKYKPLIDATKEATWAAIKMMGPDTYVNDISKEIEEVINSYQIEINGKLYDIKPIGQLGGHNIKPYIIHGGDLILGRPTNIPAVQNMRIRANECYAIETFASTGSGHLIEDSENNNFYSLKQSSDKPKFTLNITNKIYNFAKNKYGTLPFCSRWLNQEFGSSYKVAMNELVKKNMANTYAPLNDIQGSYTSQLEHTVYVHDYGKEVVSFGEDY